MGENAAQDVVDVAVADPLSLSEDSFFTKAQPLGDPPAADVLDSGAYFYAVKLPDPKRVVDQ